MDVQNLMTREVFTVTVGTDIASAAMLLREKKVSGAPVLDDDGRPVGTVSLKNLANPECPDEGVVSDIMNRGVVCIDSSATLREAAELMVKESERRLLVLADGRMVGIISSLDILPGLLRQFPNA